MRGSEDPIKSAYDQVVRNSVTAALCVLMAVALWRTGEDFARGVDGLMSSFNYFRVVVAVGCMGWICAGISHGVWAFACWRLFKRLGGRA